MEGRTVGGRGKSKCTALRESQGWRGAGGQRGQRGGRGVMMRKVVGPAAGVTAVALIRLGSMDFGKVFGFQPDEGRKHWKVLSKEMMCSKFLKTPLHLCREVAWREEQEGKQGDQLGSPCNH